MKRNWVFIYLFGSLLFYLSYGGYYILLKPRLYDLGANYLEIMLVDSLPAFIALTSFLWGRLADIFSRKKVLFIGLIGGIFVMIIGFSESINSLLLFISFVSIFYSMVFPVINTAFSIKKRYSEMFGYFTSAQSAGWAIAGFLAGILSKYGNSGIKIIYLISGMIWILSVIIFYIFYPEEAEIERERQVEKIIIKKEYIFFLSGIFILEGGITLGYGLLSIRLYEILDKSKFLYGLIWATFPATLSVLAGPLWGKIVGKYGGIKILLFLSVIYPLNIIALNFSTRIITSILWVLPLWNLMWVSILSASTKFSKEKERTTVIGLTNGIVNMAISLTFLGGFLADHIGRNLSVIIASIFSFLSFFSFLKIR